MNMTLYKTRRIVDHTRGLLLKCGMCVLGLVTQQGWRKRWPNFKNSRSVLVVKDLHKEYCI